MDMLSSLVGSATNAFTGKAQVVSQEESLNDTASLPGDQVKEDVKGKEVDEGKGEDVKVDKDKVESNEGEKIEGDVEGGAEGIHLDLDKAFDTAKGFGTFIYGMGKKATEAAVSTAAQVKSVVEEHSLIGDFKKEQDKFVKEKHQSTTQASVAPWVGYNDEDQLKEQILALSKDSRNFLRNPPAGADFTFNFDSSYPVAMALLAEDQRLTEMRFELVPKKVKEEQFWRNYFYRVSLIKQSSELISMVTEEKGSIDGTGSSKSSRRGSLSDEESDKGKKASERYRKQEDTLPVESPTQAEFVSDTYDGNEISEEELKRGMQELGMEGQGASVGGQDGGDEWEEELQRELQDYEVVGDEGGAAEGDSGDPRWEKEIQELLETEKTSGE